MDRKNFAIRLGMLGICPLMIHELTATGISPLVQDQDEKYRVLLSQKQFIENWLSDLLDSMEKHTDRLTREKIVDCPAANYRSAKSDDIHCECTRNTHKAVFETALGKPFRVDVAESLRRGGKTCHFIVYLT